MFFLVMLWGLAYHSAMIYAFDQFILDPDRVELRGPEGVVAVEPKVFALLRCLVENRDRVILYRRPDATVAQYLKALPFADRDFSRMIGAALEESGMPAQ